MKHLSPSLLFLVLIAFAVSSCKKNTTGITPKEMPELNTGVEVGPKYGMEKTGEHIYTYTSSSGIAINIHSKVSEENPTMTVTYTDFNYQTGVTCQFWGEFPSEGPYPHSYHEKLNGKHIKDRLGKGRTVIAPSGLKMTMAGEGPNKFDLTGLTIYDQGVVQHYNTRLGILEYSDFHPDFATHLDAIQPDGETLTFEVSNDRVILHNIYYEEKIGNKIEKRMDLGSTNLDNLNEVNKLYVTGTPYP